MWVQVVSCLARPTCHATVAAVMAARSYLVVDIETVVDPALPRAQTGQDGALPPPPFHQVVVIGALWLSAEYGIERLGVVGDGKSERGILEDFARFLTDRRPELVTYNGRGFDLPVIAARCLRHGVVFRHYYASRDVRYRYSPQGHLDLMDFLTDFGACRASKLDVVARAVGMPGKVGVEGKDVGPLVHAGKLAEVQAYCLCDVVQTAGVFLRLQLVRGELEPDSYRQAMAELCQRIDDDERLAPVAAGMDRARLLLEE
ncbi:MAG: 3'-5' exonuclease [Deltaproteobacteria bacterium]|nr:3'-5' exonuclease [Deltaproteobacteria bacterium]MBW2530779.1 3'-5' exonuclease [Deltaproteobacteria bacterium]